MCFNRTMVVKGIFFLVVKNNLQDPRVKGAAATAGKWMVYGKGEMMDHFHGDGIKFNKKKMIMMANSFDFKQMKVGNDEDDNTTDEEDHEDGEETITHVAKKIRRREDRDRSPEPDIFNMRASARSVRTPGS